MIRHRVEHYGPWLAAAGVALAFLLFILAGIYSIRQQSYVNRELCQQSVANRDADRLTWNAARTLILRAQTDEEGRARINQFFDGILGQIPTLECVDNQPVPKEE